MDLIFPMSQWVNSRFVLSYCNGFGEALTSYNKQTTSLPSQCADRRGRLHSML